MHVNVTAAAVTPHATCYLLTLLLILWLNCTCNLAFVHLYHGILLLLRVQCIRCIIFRRSFLTYVLYFNDQSRALYMIVNLLLLHHFSINRIVSQATKTKQIMSCFCSFIYAEKTKIHVMKYGKSI